MTVDVSKDEMYPFYEIGGWPDFKNIHFTPKELSRIKKAMIEFEKVQELIRKRVEKK